MLEELININVIKKVMNNILTKTLRNIILWLSRLYRKLNKEEISSTFSLVPQVLKDSKDIEKIQPYMNLLDKGLEDPTITNIAVSGQYGSGKSTVLKTYQSIHEGKFKYLNISLAAFNRENTDEVTDDLRDKIELSILQQIFYHEKPQNLPKSRFNRIINPSFYGKYLKPIFIIIWLIGVYVVYNNLNKLNPYTWRLDLSLDLVFFLAAIISSLGLMALVRNLFIALQGVRFSKLNYKGFEFGDDIQRSIFNRHFDEILYFFQSTKYEVVIIEDLDRFYTSEIFAKLREINITLNQSKQLKYTVNFVYALKDEILKDKTERVKFFDLIIPVIPFINSSNAGEQFIRILKELNLKDKLSEGLIDDVIIFIDDIDMRLLKNIIIEYQTYSNVLLDDLNQDNLFSMIVYKNLEPKDFGKLNRKKGKLYKLISNKSDYISKYIKEIDIKINSLYQIMKNSESEKIRNIDELKRVFLIQLFKEHKWTYRVNINNEIFRFDELLEDESFEKLRGPYRITLEGVNDRNHHDSKVLVKSFEEIEKEISPDFSYEERKVNITNKSKDKQQKNSREIENLKDRKNRLSEYTLSQIFLELDIEEFMGKFSDTPLVRNLILNGYINENYTDYISFFHEESISKSESSFIRSVMSAEKKPYNYELVNIGNILKKLEGKYFRRVHILNFDLLDFILEKRTSYEEQLSDIIEVLKSDRKDSSDFLIEYLKRDKNLDLLIPEICLNWSGLWDHVFSSEKLTKDEKIRLYSQIIELVSLYDIVEYLNESQNVTNYFNQISDYETLWKVFNAENQSNNINSIVELFPQIGVKINTIPKPSDEYLDIYKLIYANGLFELNKRNIKTILEESNENENKIDLDKSLYSSIFYSSCEPLKDQVNDNINDFIDLILLATTSSENENEECIIDLLQNTNLDQDHKFNIIIWLKNSISSIERIDDKSLTSELLIQDKVKANWLNIMCHFKFQEDGKFDKALNHFLNLDDNPKILGTERIDTALKDSDYKESDYKILSYGIIYEQNLSLNSYRNLIKSIPFTFFEINFESINTDKSKALIEQGLIKLSNYNLNSLEDHNRSIKINLFIKRQSELTKSISVLDFTENDLQVIVMSKDIDHQIRFNVINSIDENIIIAKKSVLAESCYVLSLNEQGSFSNDFIICNITSSNDWESKIKVIIEYFNQLSDREIQTVVNGLGENYSQVFKLRKRPKFDDNELNNRLFSLLENRGLINSVQKVHKKNQIRVNANHK